MTKGSNKKLWSFVALLLVLALCTVLAFKHLTPAGASSAKVGYNEVVELAEKNQLQGIHFKGDVVSVVTKEGKTLMANIPPEGPGVSALIGSGAMVTAEAASSGMSWGSIILAFAPVLLLISVYIWFMFRQSAATAASGSSAAMARAKMKFEPQTNITVSLADVAGCDEAKAEVAELVEFLREPQKFLKVGGRIPKGVLMSGPPGTGKTLLAKAIAGEAGVPFFSISGSEFVEMFVGVGAARVRELFATAKAHGSCIVFIDEIDAVGRKRGGGNGGGNDEREQTLNQMLVEMDGFSGDTGIIVLAATNRPEMLDAALMRPGRFDRQVTVSLPDVRGREQILNVHMRKTPVDADVSVSELARGTPGFSGAELGNLVNEAALFAAKASRSKLTRTDFDLAKDKLTMGPERRSTRMPEHERLSTAYHEAGHAVLGKLLKTQDPVHKVSIMPRGRSLGVTISLPQEDRYSLGKKRILEDISMLFGGRVAEELFTDDITTGASNDYDRANHLARSLVSRWGMSEAIGPIIAGEGSSVVFGFGENRQHPVSGDTMRRMDEEVLRILNEQYGLATRLLTENADKVEAMTKALMKWETIDADQIDDVMAGRTIREPREAGGAPVPQVN